jgi:hypothetical protein
VEEVRHAVERSDVVVVGMAMNRYRPKARKALAAAGVAHQYLEYGNYFNDSRRHAALRPWTLAQVPDSVRQGHADRRA